MPDEEELARLATLEAKFVTAVHAALVTSPVTKGPVNAGAARKPCHASPRTRLFAGDTYASEDHRGSWKTILTRSVSRSPF